MTAKANFNIFKRQFNKNETYKYNFSECGLNALFDYLTEIEQATGEEIIIDIVELSENFREESKEDYIKNYSNEEDNEYIIKTLDNGNILFIAH
uniref:hypothetical protein n=1 Tax=Brachyspira catarrhinii TaxID=2528966 RepID=UPI003F4B11BE